MICDFCVKMKKSLFIASLAFISVNVCGMVVDIDDYDQDPAKRAIKVRKIVRSRIDENKILEYYKSGGSFEDICKLVTSNRHFAKEKFANVISKQMTSAEKKQLVDENMDIITDYREKLLTDKGRIDKYKDRSVRIGSVCKRNFGECEDYLIRSIANSLGYDLSKIPVQWNIEYESISDVPGYIEQSIIEEDNKGLLTYDGIAKKCKTKRMIVGSVAIKKNGYRTFRRIAKSKSYKFVDLKKTTDKRLQENFGYKQSTAKRLKSYSNHYDQLNGNQKNLFKQILKAKRRKMPSNKDLNSIRTHHCKDTRVEKKFRKLLLILCNRENEINMTPHSISRLKQELEIWTSRAKREKMIK